MPVILKPEDYDLSLDPGVTDPGRILDLASIENAAAAGTSQSPFPKYVQDLTPKEQRDMRERVARLRAQLLSFLERRTIPVPGPTISARHSIVTSLGYIDIAVEELKPRYLGVMAVSRQLWFPSLRTRWKSSRPL
jgi:hypothetical protein